MTKIPKYIRVNDVIKFSDGPLGSVITATIKSITNDHVIAENIVGKYTLNQAKDFERFQVIESDITELDKIQIK
tara:strand:+ start:778 stop:999 length:222 start_codon:yes stop_codon:yes gene_type:complete